MKRLSTLWIPIFSCALVLGCSSSTEAAASLVSSNWVSADTYTGTENGTIANLRVSIDPVADPSVLTGLWSLGTNTGDIEDGGLSGNTISLVLEGRFSNDGVSLTGTVSSDAIVGTLNGNFGSNFGAERWAFNGTTVTLRRGS